MRWLIHLPYSPWSQKARWALDHHHVSYRAVNYVPMLGEPLLRLLTRRWVGRVTVPVLIDDGKVLVDSFDIARHADLIGDGSSLFPPGADSAIAGWNARSERALGAGRALLTLRFQDDPEGLASMVPSAIRTVAPPIALPLARLGAAFFRSKYGIDPSAIPSLRQELTTILEEMREALRGRTTLLDRLTYADVAMAAVLQYVDPMLTRSMRLGKAARRAWSDRELAERFADLLLWRDEIVRQISGSRQPRRDSSTPHTH